MRGSCAVWLSAASLLAGSATLAGRGAAPRATNDVRLFGPDSFAEVGPGSAPQIAATLVLEYRLSPSFRDGASLRVFLGYVGGGGRVFFHNGTEGWSDFNLAAPAEPNFTTVAFGDPGVGFVLQQTSLGYPYLGFHLLQVTGARPGATLRVTIGDVAGGGPGWLVARNESAVRLLVQERAPGAAEWRLAWPAESFPTLTVRGERADRFVVTAPSIAAPGAEVMLTVKPVQHADSPYRSSPLVNDYTGTLALSGSDPALGLPPSWSIAPADRARAVIPVRLPALPGVYRVRVEEQGNPAVRGESNPILVGAAWDGVEPRLWWGSLHNHAAPSGHALETPEFAYRYARDYADLDFFALTDHCRDNLSYQQFDWPALRELGRAFTEPGEFVAFSGFEWTSTAEGHRHVVFRRAEQVDRVPCDGAALGNDLAPSLADLCAALHVGEALAIPHHPAWSVVQPMRWGPLLDDPLQPLAEIYSWHGSSEAWDSRFPMHNDRALQHPAGSGAWLQEALAAGRRFGFTGDSDNHKGRPGSNNGGTIPDGDPARRGLFARMGVTGVFAAELTRDAIWEALRARRTIATTGARIAGAFTINGHFVGASFADHAPPRIRVRIHAADALEEVTVFRDGDRIAHVAAPWTRDYVHEFTDAAVAPGEEHSWYVRAIQADGHHLWISPIWMKWEP